MNDAVLTQLKILVERAVRPVRASSGRKRKMREELLAHVTVVFEEEAAKTGDVRVALERTAERFGNPSDLSRQLQQSVPWFGVLAALLDNHRASFWLRRGESRLRCALRQSLAFAVFCGLTTSFAILGLVGLVSLLVWDFHFLPMACLGQGLTLGYSVMMGSAVIFLAHGTWHAMYGPTGRSWAKLAIPIGLACIVGMSWPGTFLWIVDQLDGNNHTSAQAPLRLLLGWAAVGPYALIFGVNLRWRLINVPEGRRWPVTILVNLKFAALVAGGVFVLALIIFRDVSLSMESADAPLLVAAFYLLPCDLIFSAPTIAARLRADREWASLPIDGENGAAA